MAIGYSTIMYDAAEADRAVTDVGACQYDGIEVSLGDVQEVGVDSLSRAIDSADLDLYCVMGEWLESDEAVGAVREAVPTAASLGAEFFALLPPRRGLVDDETLSRWLEALCGAAVDAEIRPVLHHHGASHIEGPDEIGDWLDRSPDALELLFDTAHYYPYAGRSTAGVREGIERFADDVAYVHLKDVDPPAGFEDHVADLTATEFNLDSVINYFRSFTDLGNGELDFAAILETLDGIGFDGPLTIEIENQTRDPLVHAKRNRDHFQAVR